MFVEFKRGNTSDPFHGGEHMSFEKLFENTCATRGQIILYSTQLQTYQFRTGFFSIGIFGEVARLFRWDRAGAIVSEPIPYSQSGNLELVEFLCRFDMMDRDQRGLDPTVSDASPDEAAAFENAINTVVADKENRLLKELLDSVGEVGNYPRKKIEIPTGSDGSGDPASYIVGRSIANARSPTGRATRCFVAMSGETKELVFLKDSWRPDIPGMKGEAHWFGRLKGARNISAFLHGSDVRARRVATTTGTAGTPTDIFQHTLTNLHSEDYGGPQMMMGYIHYRTVQCEFYVPLHMFKDSKHLVEIILDIIEGAIFLPSPQLQPLNLLPAIEDLYERGILHRDISAANIMITIDGSGRLIDLDMARSVNGVGARLTVRTVSCRPKLIPGLRPADLLRCRAHGSSCRHVYSRRLERSTNYATTSNRSGSSPCTKAFTT